MAYKSNIFMWKKTLFGNVIKVKPKLRKLKNLGGKILLTSRSAASPFPSFVHHDFAGSSLDMV